MLYLFTRLRVYMLLQAECPASVGPPARRKAARLQTAPNTCQRVAQRALNVLEGTFQTQCEHA